MKPLLALKGLLQNGLAVTDGHVRTGWTVFLHLFFLSADSEVTFWKEQEGQRQVSRRSTGPCHAQSPGVRLAAWPHLPPPHPLNPSLPSPQSPVPLPGTGLPHRRVKSRGLNGDPHLHLPANCPRKCKVRTVELAVTNPISLLPQTPP